MRMLFGFTICDPVFVRQRNLTVGVKSENYTVYFLNTPGRRRGANYVNRYICNAIFFSLFLVDCFVDGTFAVLQDN